jgi:nucleosome assembly protein 1-like 1
LIFEFEKNEYFTNTLLEKTYFISEELLLKEIISTKIDWIEGKNISVKKVTKTMKNKSILN